MILSTSHQVKILLFSLAELSVVLSSIDESSTVGKSSPTAISPQPIVHDTSSPQQPQSTVTMTTQQHKEKTPQQQLQPTQAPDSVHDNKKTDAPRLLSNRKKPEPVMTPSPSAESSRVEEMMTSSSHGERQNVISPPPDMRELVNDITKSLDTPTDLDHPLSPGKGSFISERKRKRYRFQMGS